MVYIVPNLLVLHFGENFMKIRTKIAKLQMHENLHKKFYTNFHEFYEGQLKPKNMLQLYTANFNIFKMAVQYQFSPILMVQLLFSQIQQALSPDFRMVGKSMVMNSLAVKIVCIVIIGINCIDTCINTSNSALDKLLGQLGIHATWLSLIAYLQKQLRIFYIFSATFLAVITYVFLLNEAIANVPTYVLSSSAFLSIKQADFYGLIALLTLVARIHFIHKIGIILCAR